MNKLLILIPAFFLAVSTCAMEQSGKGEKSTESKVENVEKTFITRKGWGARPPKNQDKRKESATFILIGHTVTYDARGAAPTLLAIQSNCQDNLKWDDLPYNRCLDREGFQYEGRDLDVSPAMLVIKDPPRCGNSFSCGVGIIGRLDEHEDAINVTKELAIKWGLQLASLAKELGFKQLVRPENGGDLGRNRADIASGRANICGMSDLSEKYPISPGIGFMRNFDFILSVANEALSEK